MTDRRFRERMDVALWVILLSCIIKPAVQSEIGRYIIATGQTGA